jgi:hypothetical protein
MANLILIRYALPVEYLPVMLPFASKSYDEVNGFCEKTDLVVSPYIHMDTLQTLVRMRVVTVGSLNNM